MNFSPEFFGFQVLSEEDRLDGAPQFGERLVGRMLEIVASKASQDGLGVRCAQT